MTDENEFAEAIANLTKAQQHYHEVTAQLRAEKRRLTVLRWAFIAAVTINIGGALWNIWIAST